MQYVDTCVLVSLHVRDSGSAAALAWLEGRGSETIVVSSWSVVEFASALGILARRGDIAPKAHAAIVQRFRQFSAERLSLEPLAGADFERAAAWLEVYRTGLRSGDALHLALCARRAVALATADRRMLEAASVLGIRTARI